MLFLVFAAVQVATRQADEAAQPDRTIVGAGASFHEAGYKQWMVALSSVKPNKINTGRVAYTYESTGSGAGKQRLLEGQSDFAGSDSELSEAQAMQCPDCWFVPALAGAVAVIYNLPTFSGMLQIPRSELADLFSGRQMMWSELAEWNLELLGVNEPIRVHARGGSSGTTAVFTSALASFSPAFRSSPGVSSAAGFAWPRGIRQSGSAFEVVRSVLLEEYSIGYASLADARAWKAQAASISNSEGEFVQPTARAVQEAMDATVQNKLSPTEAAALVGNASSSTTKLHYLSIVDPQGAKLAYPIAGLTYVGFDAARLDCTTLYSVVFLVWWALTDCQVCQALLARLAGRPFICSTCIGTAELNYKRMS